MRRLRGWLVLGMAVHVITHVGSARGQQPPPPRTGAVPGTVAEKTASDGKAAAAASGVDDGFIEFLGSDDTGDAAWWEFLKKTPPRGTKTPPAPSQDAKS